MPFLDSSSARGPGIQNKKIEPIKICSFMFFFLIFFDAVRFFPFQQVSMKIFSQSAIGS